MLITVDQQMTETEKVQATTQGNSQCNDAELFALNNKQYNYVFNYL